MLDRSQCVLPVDEPGHNDEMHEMAREGFRCKLHLRRRVAYIEVPKCASTTVSNLLRARGAVEVLVGHPLYALCHELRVNETAPGWFRFTFVRDPLHRLFSTYYDITPPSPTALVAERERADASRERDALEIKGNDAAARGERVDHSQVAASIGSRGAADDDSC